MKRHFLFGGQRSFRHRLFLISYLLSLCFFLLSLPASAQQSFTTYLTRTTAGGGRVVLHQDSEIEALVNGGQVAADTIVSHPTPSSPTISPTNPTRRLRTNGYRVQVFAGGNDRQAKTEAYRMAALVRSTFSDVNVYTSFISPRWTCRVGDFKTHEEAVELLRQMRETQKFREASIVKSPIIVTY